MLHNLIIKAQDTLWNYRLYSVGKAVHKIRTWTSISELRALYRLAISCPRGAQVLEIGSYLGASSCYLAVGLKQIGGHLYCVDTWQNETMPDGERDTYTEFEQNIRHVRTVVTPLRMRSQSLSRLDVNVPLNLAFIDGDHSYEAVKEDFFKIKPLMAETCVIAFHDSNVEVHAGVSRFVGELLAGGEWMIGGNVGSLTWLRTSKP